MTLRRTLTTLPLVFVLFFCVSGGAYSIESLVVAVGPGLAIAILVAVPILWSLPEVLIVGELASMIPEEGGYYAWVRRAFGEFWAFQNGWWTWLYSLVDMAIYPVMFNAYLAYFLPSLPPAARWGVSLAMIWGAAAINLRGSLRVGRVSMLAGGFVLVAFALLALGASPHVTHAPWAPFSVPGTHLSGTIGVGLSIALWNYVGWDNASTVEGELVDPTRSYPAALARALPLVVLAYLVPLLPSLGATDWRTWHEGGWPDIARAAIGGHAGSILAALLALGGLVSAVALFNALLMSYSRIPYAMAQDRLLPRALGRTDAGGVPRTAVLVSAACYSVFALLPFAELVVADVLLYSLALFLEFAALVRLRRREPSLRGAFRIPVGTAGVVALALLPVAILSVVVVLGFLEVSTRSRR
ncbi:MAG TPA: APC family permease [Candidatus Elarobacter sp.]|nr:APC family permease [Candidatus Elarobacter sp.]